VDSVAAVVVVLEADVAVVAVPLVTCVVVVVVVWVEVHQAVVSAVASAVLPNSTEEASVALQRLDLMEEVVVAAMGKAAGMVVVHHTVIRLALAAPLGGRSITLAKSFHRSTSQLSMLTGVMGRFLTLLASSTHFATAKSNDFSFTSL